MKTVLVSVGEESAWRSSRLITSGLRESYLSKKSGTGVCEFRIGDFSSHDDLLSVADQIADENPEVISFLDTLSGYGPILRRLALRFSKSKRPPVLRFHVYGDFTVRSYLWQNWAPDLRNFRVEFACASKKQQRLVEASLLSPKNATWLYPFALDAKRFLFSSGRRLKTRRRLKIKPDETLILYAGRFSIQKNIPALIRTFARLNPPRCKLVLAGEFDDIGTPASSEKITAGRLHELILQELDLLPPGLRSQVVIARGLSSNELLDLYNAADIYFSLSLQHDEDFGMAPAEASVNGLSLVLTDWGGYSDFREAGAFGCWVPVRIADDGVEFKFHAAVYAVAAVLHSLPTLALRRTRGEKVAKYFSVEAATNRLRKRQAAPPPSRFLGFKPTVQSLAVLFNSARGHLVFDRFGQGSVYEQVYKNYV